jgi:hypothetical protein
MNSTYFRKWLKFNIIIINNKMKVYLMNKIIEQHVDNKMDMY